MKNVFFDKTKGVTFETDLELSIDMIESISLFANEKYVVVEEYYVRDSKNIYLKLGEIPFEGEKLLLKIHLNDIGLKELEVKVLSRPIIDDTNEIVHFILPNKDRGFNYGYYLVIPENAKKNTSIVVETNNSGVNTRNVVDYENVFDFIKYNRAAETIINSGFPYLVPIFQRIKKEKSNIYTHALTSEAILADNKLYSRLDVQLIRMINNAKELLRENNYIVNEKVVMVGQGASATFASRFAMLHPTRVRNLILTKTSALLITPITEYKGEVLNYPIGIDNIKKLIGKGFNLEAYNRIKKIAIDAKQNYDDPASYDDSYTKEEQKIIFKALGKKMFNSRYNTMKKLYKKGKVKNFIFKEYSTYEKTKDKFIEEIERVLDKKYDEE